MALNERSEPLAPEDTTPNNVYPSLTEVQMKQLPGDFEAFQEFLELGGNPNWTDERGYGFLHACALYDAAAAASLILPLIDVNMADNDGLTALHYAALEGSADLIKVLLKHGAKINGIHEDISCTVSGFPIYTCGGQTPLHWACARSAADPEAAKILVESGADLKLKDFSGATPADRALFVNNKEIFKLLNPDGEWPDKSNRKKRRFAHTSQTRERVIEQEKKGKTINLSRVLKHYTPKHPQVYEYKPEYIFAPEFLEVVRQLDSKESLDEVDVSCFQEPLKGIFVFPCLSEQFCKDIIEEVGNIELEAQKIKLPLHRPNSMNRYGCILNELGFQDFLSTIMNDVLSRLSTRLLPLQCGTAYTFQSHYSFIIRYKFEEDVKLDTHVDSSAITLNVCLGREFEGATLYFHALKSSDEDKEKGPDHEFETPHPKDCPHCRLSIQHKPGVGLLHSGDFIHGADPLTAGERHNLIMWCRV